MHFLTFEIQYQINLSTIKYINLVLILLKRIKYDQNSTR